MTLTFTCDLEFAILHVVFGSVTVTEKLLRDKFYQISCTETHWREQFKWIIILWPWPWTLYLNTCIGKRRRLRKQSTFIKWHNIQICYCPICFFFSNMQEEKGAIIPTQPQITLIKKDDTGAKSLNESFLSKLRPFRGSTSAATLVALTGGDPLSTKKEERKWRHACTFRNKHILKSLRLCDN